MRLWESCCLGPQAHCPILKTTGGKLTLPAAMRSKYIRTRIGMGIGMRAEIRRKAMS